MSSDELIEEGKRTIWQDCIRGEVSRNDGKDESGKFAKRGTLKEGLRRQDSMDDKEL
jgi:hypothetical protein